MPRILIIEQNANFLWSLERSLGFQGYEVIPARSGEMGMNLLSSIGSVDMIIADAELPDIDGYEVCQQLRDRGDETPIIMLSSSGDEADEVMAFELGVDDYIVKPVSTAVLIARIKAVLRRTKSTNQMSGEFRFGDVVVDFDRRTITNGGEQVALSRREFDLLAFLISCRGRALSREIILEEVWGYDYYGTVRTVDTFITRLRQKIEPNPATPKYILTVRGIGYRFADLEEFNDDDSAG